MSPDGQDAPEEARYQEIGGVDPLAPGALEALARGLYDPGWRVRKRAAERLALVPGPDRVVDRLLQVLADRGETGARNAAAEALVHLGEVASPRLISLLGHPDPDQRKFAADILGLIRSPDAGPALASALADPDPNVRLSAAEALGHVGGPGAPRALEVCLGHEDVLLRLGALEALLRLGAPPPLPLLTQLSKEPALRRGATRLLGHVRQPAALAALARALQSETPQVKEAALFAVGLQARGADETWHKALEKAVGPALRSDPAGAKWLLDALEAEAVETKAGAVFALSLLPEPALAPKVAEAARDDRLTEDAVRALARMGPSALGALAASLDALGAQARIVAVEALVLRADPSLVPALAALTGSAEPEVQLLAVRALGRTRSAAALPALTGLLGDEELSAPAGRALAELGRTFPREVKAALEEAAKTAPTPGGIRVLGEVAKADALWALRSAARAPDPRLRAAAAAAAGEAGPQGADLLRALLADESARVRAAAAWALHLLPPATSVPLLRLALSDDDPEVRLGAADAAAELEGTQEAEAALLAPALEALLDGPGAAALLAARAVRALSRLGRFDEGALRKAAAHPDPEVVREALSAGAALEEGARLARAHLHHPSWDVRVAAAQVLAASGDTQARAEVEDRLSQERDPLVRDALERARAQLQRR